MNNKNVLEGKNNVFWFDFSRSSVRDVQQVNVPSLTSQRVSSQCCG